MPRTELTAEGYLQAYEAGTLTRSELVSQLALLPEVPLEDAALSKDVDIHRVAIDIGQSFEIRSWC